MAHQFDATLKDILSPSPEDFVPVFGLPQTQPASTLNVDLSTISAATDVAIGFGSPVQEIVDLNFQSGPDREVESRCLLYNAALRFRFGVPVRTLLILLRPKADSPALRGKLAYTSGASGVEFHYELVRMWQRAVEPFLRGGLPLLPLATLCQMPPDRPIEAAMRDVVHEIDRRLIAECENATGVRLMTAALVLSGLRVKRENLGSIFDGVRIMQEESVAWDYYHEEGEIDAVQRVLLRQGQRRCGKPDEATIAAVKEIRDLDRLERLADAILDASSWQELLATP